MHGRNKETPKLSPMSRPIENTDTANSNPDASNKNNILRRVYVAHQPRWQRFVVRQPGLVTTDAPYNRQYSHLYTTRLMELRPRCLRAAAEGVISTKNAIVVPRIIDLKENMQCTAVGTLVKDCSMNNSNDALPYSSYFGESNVTVNSTIEPPLRSFCSEKDILVLEDESGRVELLLTDQTRDNNGNLLSIHDVATGVVVAVTGMILPDSNGVMTVSTVAFPELLGPKLEDRPQTPLLPQQQQMEPCVLLVSGLRFCSNSALEPKGTLSSHSLRTDLLLDFITGNLPTLEAHGARIAHVILAGGNCGPPEPLPTATNGTEALHKGSKKREAQSATLPVQELDMFLTKLVSWASVSIDILPGGLDPTNANWPQQPLHPCLFPFLSACTRSSSDNNISRIHRTTNPYEALIGGRLFLGTDGQNVQDLRHFLLEDCAMNTGRNVPTELKTMEYTLKFSHVAPTAPSSLHTSPLLGQDPFILRELPDVYFSGNCSKFDTCEVFVSDQRCRLVCIPDFSITHEAVLLNLCTLETESIKVIDYDDSADFTIHGRS